jgi:hypothetical protein
MSIAQQSSIPAGWYPDPEGRPEKRWWNGSGWTGSYAPVVAAPVAAAPAIPMTFMLTDPSQLASVPPGPGYSSLLATLSRTPTYADPITAPTDLAGGAYATAPAPSIHPPTVTPPAPAPTSPAVLAIAAAPSAPAPSAPAPSAAFTPPASWAPPVVPTAPVPASIANVEPRVFSYAPQPDAEVPREFRVPAPNPYLAPVATESPVAAAPALTTAAPITPVELPEEPRIYGMTSFGTPRLAPIGSAGSAPLVAPFAAPVREERPVDLSAIADDAGYQPFGMVPMINRGQVGPPAIVYTGSAWVLAMLPLLAGGAAISLALFLSEFYSRFAQVGLVAVVVLAAFIAAVKDRKELSDAGHHNAASAAWVLLTPFAYLTVRTVRTYKLTRRGFGPLIATIVATGIIAAAFVLLPEWVPTLLLNPLG